MAEDHDDGPIHQAPWVVPVTVGICLGFVLVMMLIRLLLSTAPGSV